MPQPRRETNNTLREALDLLSFLVPLVGILYSESQVTRNPPLTSAETVTHGGNCRVKVHVCGDVLRVDELRPVHHPLPHLPSVRARQLVRTCNISLQSPSRVTIQGPPCPAFPAPFISARHLSGRSLPLRSLPPLPTAAPCSSSWPQSRSTSLSLSRSKDQTWGGVG